MVTAKSMELTGEIEPGWLEAFAVHKKYLPVVMFNAVDLSEGGVSTCVLGALPMFTSPFAMRPHYGDTWVGHVRQRNLAARAECIFETGVDDVHILEENATKSGEDVTKALKLLCDVCRINPYYQMRPIF
eukprot:5673581-Prymnesium_polylepis.2